jgi:hypothetical protein
MDDDLRPRGVGEILDAAVTVLRARFGAFVLLTVVVLVPVQLFSLLVSLSTRPDDVTRSFTGTPAPIYDSPTSTDLWVAFAAVLVVGIATLLANAFATATVTHLAASTYLGEGEDPGEVRASWRLVLQRFWAVLGLTVLVSAATFGGLALCVIPGVWIMVTWSVAVPVLLLEGGRVFASLGRSFNLTKTRWWTALAVLLVGNLFANVVTLAFSIPLELLLSFAVDAGPNGTLVANSVAGTLSAALTTPFLATATVVLYFDLRVRAEGFDVQMLLQRLGPAPAIPR